MFDIAQMISCGTAPPPAAAEMPGDTSSRQRDKNSAPTGTDPTAALANLTLRSISVPAAEKPHMVLSNVHLQRGEQALTPLNHEAWRDMLRRANLLDKYTTIPPSILHGFRADIPIITYTYTPPNRILLPEHQAAFKEIIEKELQKGRWLGPFSQHTIESVLGPFQTSPVSIVPKSGRPGRFRLVQNLSYPHSPTLLNPLSDVTISSINSNIDSSLYPCLWGTFANTCRLLWTLPPGSQGAVRDVSEAYRTIPLHPSQWPGAVVRLSDNDNFAVDTCNMFGLSSAPGIFGHVADAGVEIFRSQGIGPLTKWVDDHLWLRVRREWLDKANAIREELREHVKTSGGFMKVKGGLLCVGETLPLGRQEEFDDDFSFALSDLSQLSPRSQEDKKFTYAFCDIDQISSRLGYLWEHTKDIQFGYEPVYFGLQWHINVMRVLVPGEK